MGKFNISPSIIVRTSRQRISKVIKDLHIINQLDLIDIYRTLHPMTEEYTSFQDTWNIHQDRLYSGPESKFQQIKKDSHHTKYMF